MSDDSGDFTIPTAKTNDEKWFLKSYLKQLTGFIIRIAYYHGHDARKDYGQSPDFKKFKVRWVQHYGCMDLHVHDERNQTRHDLRVFGQNEYRDYSPDFDMTVAIYSDGVLSQFFPGILIEQSIRQCSIPVHFLPKWNQFMKADGVDIDLAPRITTCTQKNGKWVCDSCVRRYEVPAYVPKTKQESPKEKSERAKMTVGMRYEVLERCKFTCGLCGRSPLKGDDIKLHVDHILPIAKGGKTTHDNLWALCVECNLGKSDRIIDQLAMGFVNA